VARLRDLKLDAYVVDLTTPEAHSAGLVVVKVIVPKLQPFWIEPRAQFRANPRLYDLPDRLGYPVHREADLNPWAQPLA
jgi:ribosomal protein S12 methylthiotransferase accessory factor